MKLKNSLKKAAFCALAVFGMSSLYAGNASTHIHWTRGYDGTIDGYNATTTNDVFDENFNFTDRMIAGANRIIDVDNINPAVVDPVTGARTASSSTPTVTGTGSLYLHVGYTNSGFTGAGNTIDAINLNGDLVIGRMGIENANHNEPITKPPYTVPTPNPNIPLKITSGANEHWLSFDFSGGSANEMIFFRRSTLDTAASFQFDCNMEFEISGAAIDGGAIATIYGYNHMIFGSEEYDRKLNLLSGSTKTTNFIMNGSTTSKVTVHSDVNVQGAVVVVYRGIGEYLINGNTTINSSVTDTFIVRSGGSNASVGTTVNGSLTVGTTANTFNGVYMNTIGQTLNFNGDISFNTEGSATSSAAVFFLEVADTKIISRGNITINHSGKGDTKGYSLTLAYLKTAGQSVDFHGKIEITRNSYNTSLARLMTSNQVVNYHGDIKITSNTFSETIMGEIATGSVVNFIGHIDTSARSSQTSFKWGGAGIANFKGSKDNNFHNLGFRTAVFNLMNTSGAAANITNTISFGSNSKVNIFGQGQLKIADTANWALWGPTNNISGTLNLNGTSITMGKFNPAGASRYFIVDFGMSDSGMTSAQMAQQGITADMIHATGVGFAQTFTLGDISYGTGATVEACYILFRNYIVGEDSIISKVRLSGKTVGTSACFSESDIVQNILRIEGYTDATKYGVEYYLQETALIDGTWKYELIVIPEPATVAIIMGLGALAFVAWRRRK